MWLYTGSLGFTILAALSIALSLGVAYWFYRIVLGLPFFPFINLLVLVLAVGIGADDTFILRRVWMSAKAGKNPGKTLAKLVTDSLSHGAMSMLVTSLTTAAAFLTNLFSSVIAIRCFGLFAGIAILANYALVISWLPAGLVLVERSGGTCSFCCEPDTSGLSASCCCKCCCSVGMRNGCGGGSSSSSHAEGPPPPPQASVIMMPTRQSRFHPRRAFAYLRDYWLRRYEAMSDWGRVVFEKILPCVIIKARYLWLLSLGGLSIFSAIALFHAPGIHLAHTDAIQLFRSHHPIERYDRDLRERFSFLSLAANSVPLPIRIVWGIDPTPYGATGPASRREASSVPPSVPSVLDMLDPSASMGSLTLPHPLWSFNSSLSLHWLRDFCQSLAMQNFTAFGPGRPLLPHCFVHDFFTWMQGRECASRIDGSISNEPCCRNRSFPYSTAILQRCIWEAAGKIKLPGMAYEVPTGPLFSTGTRSISGMVVEFYSRYNFSFAYPEMRSFDDEVGGWISRKLAAAPAPMRSGWFVSELAYYDLQRALLSGTRLAVLVAVVIAFVVLIGTTGNLLLAFLAILSITSVIFVTLASLILLGWELNVLESTIIILTVGLSFDFTLHHAVAYRLAATQSGSNSHRNDSAAASGSCMADRESLVIAAVSMVGSPIFMSAMTTFCAGLAMLPATTLAFFQIGVFMMLVTGISWVYATFFFISMLHLWGPVGNSCELAHCLRCCFRMPWSGPSPPSPFVSHPPSAGAGGTSLRTVQLATSGNGNRRLQVSVGTSPDWGNFSNDSACHPP